MWWVPGSRGWTTMSRIAWGDFQGTWKIWYVASGLKWLLNLFLEKYSKVLLFYVRWTSVHICPRAINLLLISLTIYSTGMLTLTIHRTLCWSVMLVEPGKQTKQVTLDALVRCIPARDVCMLIKVFKAWNTCEVFMYPVVRLCWDIILKSRPGCVLLSREQLRLFQGTTLQTSMDLGRVSNKLRWVWEVGF